MLFSLLAFAVSACTEEATDAYEPGSTIVESIAPDSLVRATVVVGADEGEYVVRIYDVETKALIAEGETSAPLGYHSHRISLDWSTNADTVITAIDYDFGDNNIVYRLAR